MKEFVADWPDAIFTEVTVPFEDHPEFFKTQGFNARVVTGEALSIRLDNGEAVTL